MLTKFSSSGARDCTHQTRRDFIQVGTLGLGALTLDWLLQQRASADSTATYLRDKSVVLLFLSGGPTHIETFNPNLTAPAPYHSLTGEVKTTLPGVTFGGTFPLLAKRAHQMAIVRSLQHPIGGHVQAIVHMLTGGTDPLGRGETGYSMGSVYARLRGANHPKSGMPTFGLLNSDEVDRQYRSERGRVERGSRPLGLGPSYAPFNPAGGGTAVSNMVLKVPRDRFDDRRALLQALDQLKRRRDRQPGFEGAAKHTQQAFDVILGNAADAFDLTKESPRVLQRYDTRHMSVGHKSYRPSELGRHMLTARRMIEAGCGFVTVHSAGWDMHADSNNPGINKGMEMLGRPVDRAVSAFLEDLEQRGMSDDVLFIVTGDFGRTPKVNNRGGRDHWANLGTLAFAGGGWQMGRVIGRSAPRNDVPASDPVSPADMMATVMHTLFDVGQLRLAAGLPRELLSLAERAQPILTA